MSKLEELIQELCPDGVEFKTLGEISHIIRGASPRPIKKFLTTSETGINWIKIGDVRPGEKYINEAKEHITPSGAEKSRFVKKGDFILSNSMSFGRPYILNIDGCIHDGWLSISNFERSVEADYLYYVLVSSSIQDEMAKRASFGGAVQNLNVDIVKCISIPVPPMEVQSEIVRILDNFTELTEELTEELTAELTARKKQYTYYRDNLLTFDNSENSLYSVKWYALGDIARIVRGASPRPIKNYLTEDSNGVNWIKIGDAIPESKYITSAQEKITSEGAKKSRFVEPGNFILSNSMSFGRPYILKTSGCIHDGWLSISGFEQYLLSDYLYYILISTPIQNEMRKKASFGGAVQNLNADIVRNIKIPVPPLKVQNLLVAILDRFDLLCNDLSEGIPAEIEARQEQYEYYRDKLLTFKEKSA